MWLLRTVSLVLIVVFNVGLTGTARADGMELKESRQLSALDAVTLNRVEVQAYSGDLANWQSYYSDTTPKPLTFRWRTAYSNVASARWYVLDNSGQEVSQGFAGGAPKTMNHNQAFTVDFATIAKNTTAKPIRYSLHIETFGQTHASATQGERPLQDAMSVQRHKPTASLAQKTGQPSRPVYITFTDEGSGTEFTTEGLNPMLKDRMRIGVELEELDLLGIGVDEEPYLFVAAVFADGITIKPEVTVDDGRVFLTFGSSTVRVMTADKTHENVPSGSPGDQVAIPATTGYFETDIQPIGHTLAQQLGATSQQLDALRKETQIGIVVIGMEEDAVPSTGVVDETRDLFVRRLTEELNALVQSIRIEIDPENVTFTIPDLNASIGELRRKIRKELVDFAKCEGFDELREHLAIPAWPMVLALGGGNADDYIGNDMQLFNYQQLLDAGEQGIEFELLLDQNCKCGKPWYIQRDRTEELFYEIDGRVRLILD